ncbi:hypothetical protein C790_02173 [Morganella morganii SC01]|nr:hypothetical protein C790_02173 [Morganella morganii SC01]
MYTQIQPDRKIPIIYALFINLLFSSAILVNFMSRIIQL